MNPRKCRVYFGGVDENAKDKIKRMTNFEQVFPPFKYFEVPLTSKKLSTHNYVSLIDKIVCRIRNWSNGLLSYAGRIQLIKFVSFAIANYWMQCLPLPKHVIHKIEVVFRSLLWTGGSDVSSKSHIVWKKIAVHGSVGA